MNKKHFFTIIVLWIAIHVLLFRYPGLRFDLFDSKGYRMFGELLIEHGQLKKLSYIFYILPIFLIGLFDSFKNGLVAFIVFQSLISLLATFSLYHAASKLFSQERAGLFAALIFLFWWDTIQWNTALLTESIACSLICFLLYALTNFVNSARHYAIIIFLLLAGLLTRPTGIISILATIVFLLVRNWSWLSSKPVYKFGIAAIISLILVSGAMVMFSIWDFSEQYVRGNIVTYMDSIEGEALYDETLRLPVDQLIYPDSSRMPLAKMVEFVYRNPEHFIKAAGLKIFYLLAGVRPYYSWLHNLALIIFLSVIYFLSCMGYTLISRKDIKAFVVASIVVNCLLIAIATVDWDNRFYVPMVPGLVLLSAGGGLKLLHMLSRFITPKEVGQHSLKN